MCSPNDSCFFLPSSLPLPHPPSPFLSFTLHLFYSCHEERYPLLLLSNDSSVVVLERETWQSSNVDLTERVLSIPAGPMDADYTDNILYWISTEDGVSGASKK